MPMSDVSSDLPPVVKDENDAHPIAGSWRPMLRDVVRHFCSNAATRPTNRGWTYYSDSLSWGAWARCSGFWAKSSISKNT